MIRRMSSISLVRCWGDSPFFFPRSKCWTLNRPKNCLFDIDGFPFAHSSFLEKYQSEFISIRTRSENWSRYI